MQPHYFDSAKIKFTISIELKGTFSDDSNEKKSSVFCKIEKSKQSNLNKLLWHPNKTKQKPHKMKVWWEIVFIKFDIKPFANISQL